MNQEIVVTAQWNPETGGIGIRSNLSQDPVGRLAMQQVLQKAIVAIDQLGRQENKIVLPEIAIH